MRRGAEVRPLAVLLLLAGCASPHAASPDALYAKSEKLLREGNVREALAVADAGFNRERSWRFRLERARALLAIRPKQALEALDGPEESAAPEQKARREMYRAKAEFYLGDFAGAAASLDHARGFSAGLSLPLLDAEMDIDRGTLAAQQGHPEVGREFFEHALRAATAHDDSEVAARAMVSIGVLLQFTERPDQAIYWLEKGRDLSARAGLTSLLANALGNLGSSYLRLGDYDKAAAALRQAEALFGAMGNRQQQQMWIGNQGTVLHDTGDLHGAAEKYQQAYAMAVSVGDLNWAGCWVNNLALTSISLGNFDTAERYNQEALRLKTTLPNCGASYPRVNEAHIAAGRRDFARAEKLYRAILAKPTDDPVPMLDAQSGLAQALVEAGQSAQADAQFRAGIETVERRRARLDGDEYKLSYFSSLIDFYQRYVDFLVARGETDRAAEVADASRARLLDDRLNQSRPAPAPSVAAFRRLAWSSHAIVLSYWLAPARSFLWIITPDRVMLHLLPGEKQIEPLVESYRSFIENLRDPLTAEFPDGRRLSEILLGPVRPLLKDGARLVIVPDRALHSLNFETLPDPDGAAHYLIDRATVLVAPSLSVLTAPRAPAHRSRRILLIGDPDPAVEEFPKLPYASREMDRIGQSFGPANCTRLSGAGAFPAAYRAAGPAQYSWIHFAAHASANRENPLDSALILSRHDGVYALPAREVMEIPLHADLVTLSACRGAGAKTYSGEGLVGLAWAFLRAGARNVVAGLWDVTDLSTASLMADFYQQMENNLAPCDALRAAKLKLVHSTGAYRKPFYWGPFQLYAGSGP